MSMLHASLVRCKSYMALHLRIIWALLLRELATRYGRDNLGFLWVVAEPLMFCAGVLVMWSIIRPPYENGIKLIPFIVTGYAPLLLIRHMIGQGIFCAKVNSNLLYHRNISLLHLFISRSLLEFLGTTLAFAIVVAVLLPLKQIDAPESVGHVYVGWLLLTWLTFGVTLIFGSLSALSEVVERAMSLITYVMIPVSGAFYMVAWVPYQYREAVDRIPFVNCIEIIRRGFFGEFHQAYYHIGYTVAWCLVLTFLGLLSLQFIRDRLEVE